MEAQKVTCPECGWTDYPQVTRSYEHDDRDENRGIMMTFIECYNCRADISQEINPTRR